MWRLLLFWNVCVCGIAASSQSPVGTFSCRPGSLELSLNQDTCCQRLCCEDAAESRPADRPREGKRVRGALRACRSSAAGAGFAADLENSPTCRWFCWSQIIFSMRVVNISSRRSVPIQPETGNIFRKQFAKRKEVRDKHSERAL